MRLFKVIYWSSIFFICCWILMAILGKILPLEFTDDKMKSAYENFRFYGFPIAILLTLTGTIKPNDTSSSTGGKILLTLFVSGASVFFMIITTFAGMCSWTTSRVYFENKHDPTIKIVQRDFGCGATDSGRPIFKTFKVKEITKHFVWVSEIDTNTVDISEWERIDD